MAQRSSQRKQCAKASEKTKQKNYITTASRVTCSRESESKLYEVVQDAFIIHNYRCQ